jgi:hypothetical protein
MFANFINLQKEYHLTGNYIFNKGSWIECGKTDYNNIKIVADISVFNGISPPQLSNNLTG